MLAFLDVPITIWRAAEHVYTTSLGAMPFTPPRSLGDLRPLIFGNHSLKLQHEPLLGGFAAGGFQKDRLHTMTGEFLDQQNLISVLTTQAIRRVNQHHLNLTFGRQIPQTFQAWSRQHRSAVTLSSKIHSPGTLNSWTLACSKSSAV